MNPATKRLYREPEPLLKNDRIQPVRKFDLGTRSKILFCFRIPRAGLATEAGL